MKFSIFLALFYFRGSVGAVMLKIVAASFLIGFSFTPATHLSTGSHWLAWHFAEVISALCAGLLIGKTHYCHRPQLEQK